MIHRLILDSIEEDLLAVPQNLNDICIFTEDAEFDTRPRTDINYCLNWFPPGSNGDEAKKQQAGHEHACSFHVETLQTDIICGKRVQRAVPKIRTNRKRFLVPPATSAARCDAFHLRRASKC